MEIPEVAQPLELGGNLYNVIMLLLLEGRYLDGEEMESLQITHVAQERSKCGQGGQIQVQLTCTSWIQSSCTMLTIFTILSIGIEMIFSFLQHRWMEAFLCSTHLMR